MPSEEPALSEASPTTSNVEVVHTNWALGDLFGRLPYEIREGIWQSLIDWCIEQLHNKLCLVHSQLGFLRLNKHYYNETLHLIYHKSWARTSPQDWYLSGDTSSYSDRKLELCLPALGNFAIRATLAALPFQLMAEVKVNVPDTRAPQDLWVHCRGMQRLMAWLLKSQALRDDSVLLLRFCFGSLEEYSYKSSEWLPRTCRRTKVYHDWHAAPVILRRVAPVWRLLAGTKATAVDLSWDARWPVETLTLDLSDLDLSQLKLLEAQTSILGGAALDHREKDDEPGTHARSRGLLRDKEQRILALGQTSEELGELDVLMYDSKADRYVT